MNNIKLEKSSMEYNLSVYKNLGNDLILSMIPANALRILDIGCGAGDNARRIKIRNPLTEVIGITINPAEALIAREFCSSVFTFDVESERDSLDNIGGPFDVIVFSHVLEHLINPTRLLRKVMGILSPGGYIVIAVPNVLEWRTRLQFLLGNFDYADGGILDRTHLKFYTCKTAQKELVDPIKGLRIISRVNRGAVPLGPFRKYLLPALLRRKADDFAVSWCPNLFASEIGMLIQKVL